MICTQSRRAWFRHCNPLRCGLIYVINESRLLSLLKGDFFLQMLLMGGAPRWSAASHAGIIRNKSQFTDPLTPRTLTSRKLHPRNDTADNSILQSSLLCCPPPLEWSWRARGPLSQTPTRARCCPALRSHCEEWNGRNYITSLEGQDINAFLSNDSAF